MTNRRKIMRQMLVASTSMALIMLIFEYAKDLLFGNISLWTSHIITIIFSTVVAGTISYIVSFKYRKTSIYKQQLKELENKKTELERLNKELKTEKDRAKESDRLKTAFLSNLSHEIRTPLHGLNGFTNLLMKKDLTLKKQKTYQDEIAKATEHILSLIDNVVEYSKIETDGIKIDREVFSANELITSIFLKASSVNQKPKSIDISLNIEEENLMISNDRKKAMQVLQNLVSNSLKFTSKGFIKIGVKKQELENNILFYVEDSGIGIDQDIMPHIFKHFRQGDESETRQYGGLGMGLAVSKRFVEAMGGHIWAESKLNEGSKFNFTLPLYQTKNFISETKETKRYNSLTE